MCLCRRAAGDCIGCNSWNCWYRQLLIVAPLAQFRCTYITRTPLYLYVDISFINLCKCVCSRTRQSILQPRANGNNEYLWLLATQCRYQQTPPQTKEEKEKKKGWRNSNEHFHNCLHFPFSTLLSFCAKTHWFGRAKIAEWKSLSVERWVKALFWLFILVLVSYPFVAFVGRIGSKCC